MSLSCQITGMGKDLIILHGLYGSGDNWLSIAHAFESEYTVYLPDLRNHGKSFHSDLFEYDNMVSDIEQLFDEQGITSAIVMGHSMGGKLAMKFALKHPDKVTKMIIVDIAPKSYVGKNSFLPQMQFHRSIMDSLLAMPIDKFLNRSDAEKWLSNYIAQPDIRQFLLKNLRRGKDKRFYWQINLAVLSRQLPYLLDDISDTTYREAKMPVLFIKGENSPYIDDADEEHIAEIFPNAEVVTIFDAGHWVHAEQPERFVQVLAGFLTSK